MSAGKRRRTSRHGKGAWWALVDKPVVKPSVLVCDRCGFSVLVYCGQIPSRCEHCRNQGETVARWRISEPNELTERDVVWMREQGIKPT